MYLDINGPLACLLLGMTLLVSVRLIHGDPYSPPREAILAWLHWAARLLLVAAFLGFAATSQGPLVLIFLLGLAIVWARVTIRRRTARQSLAASYLAISAEHQFPLPLAAAALAQDEALSRRGRAVMFADLLQRGMSLPDALAHRKVAGMFPPHFALLSAVGMRTSRLGAVLREAVQAHETETRSRESFRDVLIYFCGVNLASLMILVFVQIKLVPTIRKLVDEFDVGTARMQRTLELIGSDAALTILALGAYLLMGVLVILLLPTLAAGLLQLLGSLEPILARLSPDTRRKLAPKSASVLRLFAHAVDAQAPTTGVAETMVERVPNFATRRCLMRLNAAIERGAPFPDALGQAGLTSPPETNLLTTAARVGNLPWALRRLAALRERRVVARRRWLEVVVVPALLIVPVTLAALASFGMIWVLVALVEQMV